MIYSVAASTLSPKMVYGENEDVLLCVGEISRRNKWGFHYNFAQTALKPHALAALKIFTDNHTTILNVTERLLK